MIRFNAVFGRMVMQRLYGIVLIAVSLSLMSCCPATSLNPLSPPGSAKYDKRIEGTWVPVPQKDEKGYLHIGKAEDNLTRVLAVTMKENGELEYSAFTVFPTMDGKESYLNIKAEEVLDELPSDEAGYVFARYTLNDDGSLSVYYMDDDSFLEAVKEKKLEGKVTVQKPDREENNGNTFLEREVECVRITDSSEKILQFIRDNLQDAFYTDGIHLRRIESAPPPATDK